MNLTFNYKDNNNLNNNNLIGGKSNSNENYFSGSMRGYSGKQASNSLSDNNFLSGFNPKNYVNNPNHSNIGKLPSPSKIFSNYYLNNQDVNYDKGYSKKKELLIKDYLSKDKPDRDEFIK